jgi:hypothetical protein
VLVGLQMLNRFSDRLLTSQLKRLEFSRGSGRLVFTNYNMATTSRTTDCTVRHCVRGISYMCTKCHMGAGLLKATAVKCWFTDCDHTWDYVSTVPTLCVHGTDTAELTTLNLICETASYTRKCVLFNKVQCGA